MRVLVTGATGFVGGRVSRRYVDQGDDVTAIVRTPSTALDEIGVRQVGGGFDAIDREALDGIDLILHTAATSGPDLPTARAVNQGGTARLVDAALAAGAPRLVHISTTSVYDRSATPGELHETSPLVTDSPSAERDASPYAVTKAEAEGEVRRGIDAGLPAAILRPPAVLGAGPTSTWGTRVPRALVESGAYPMPLDATFGWVHIEDLVDAVLAAGRSHDVFTANVVGGHVPFSAYLDAILAMLPDPPRIGPAPDTPPWRGRYARDRAPSILGIPIDRRFEDSMAEIADSWRAGDPGGVA